MLFLCLFIWQNAWGQQSETKIGEGNLNNTGTVTWTLWANSKGKCRLVISGTGDIQDFSSYTAVPWANITTASGNQDVRSVITAISVGEGITSIGRGVFNNTAITSFKIPSTCTSIGLYAFRSCSKLKEIYIPENVTSIAQSAFNNCSGLSLVHYDGRCSSSTAISLRGLATNGKIIEKAGAYTTELSYVDVPEGWDYYTHGVMCHSGAWVATSDTKLFFYSNTSGAGVDYATVGNLDAAYQDNRAYHPWRVNCYKYTSLEINKNIASIGENEFLGYSDSDVSKMGYTKMQTITVENGNSSFVVGDEGALYNKAKTKLYLYPAKSTAAVIEVPSTVTEIGSGAFYGASNLNSISFLGTVSKIGEYSFSQASSLNYMYFATETAPSDYPKPSGFNSSAFIGISDEGLVAANASTDDFILFTKYVRGNGIRNWTFDGSSTSSVRTYISNGTLYVKGNGEYTTPISSASWYSDRSSITKIIIEEGITDICSSAFEGCSNVKEVTLNNKGRIGSEAFKNCTEMTRVNIGRNVTGFGSYSFLGCPVLSNVNVADFVSFNDMFGIDQLTNGYYGTAESKELMINGERVMPMFGLEIPEGMESVQNEAIRYFGNLKKIHLPSTITWIRARNFLNCKYLEEITLPSTVTAVGASAFEGCTRLWEVTLNNTGTIGAAAFKNCTQLSYVNIGTGLTGFNNVTSETDYPFFGCSNLTYINITDFALFNAIGNLRYLTDSSYGTKAGKTLQINGVNHNPDVYFHIPEGITSYNNGALIGFSNVKKICLPNTMTEVSGFNNHSYMTRVVLRSTVKSVSAGAFSNCSALQCITCRAKTPPTVTDSIATNQGMIILKVPHDSDCKELYAASPIWKKFIYTYFLRWTTTQEKCNMEIYANESKTPEHSILTTEEVLHWTTDNESIATVDNDGVVTGCHVTYNGTTSDLPKAVIKADLIECDELICDVTVFPSEVTLTDGNPYLNTEDFTAESISYTRTFNATAGKWQCLYVPFDIEVTDDLLEDFDFAKLYMVSYHDANNNGEIEDNEPLRMTFSRIYAGKTLHANMPYYIRSKSSGKKTIEVTNTTLKAAANGSVNCSTTEHEYTLVGIYNTTNINGRYTMASDGTFSYYTKDTNLKANRWYMEVTSRTGSGVDLENYARPIEIVVEGDEETTGIADLEDKASDPKNDKIYTLDGRQVTDYDTLPSGIYIINGKKVFKK